MIPALARRMPSNPAPQASADAAVRRAALERNPEELRMLADIVQTADDAIITKTLEGLVTTWNHGAEKLFGYTAAEMIGQSMRRLYPADRQDEEPQLLARIARGERVEQFDTIRHRKDGTRVYLSSMITPIVARDGRVIG